MTANPITTTPEVLTVDAGKALEHNRRKAITVLPVVNEDRQLQGLFRLHELVQTHMTHLWQLGNNGNSTSTGSEALVLDVDGVLTDGGLWFSADGQLQKRFDVRDGLGIKLLQQDGLKLAFLSGHGATEGGLSNWGLIIAWSESKNSALAQLQTDLGIAQQQTGFIGDDLNDLAVRKQINLLITPADACAAVRRQAD